MRLSDLGEFGLIEKIRRSFSGKSSRAPLGIGDDAAALTVSPSSMLLATTDMLIEGVHFDLAYTDFYSLGWKSAAVNLSDIAAMGGVPHFCLTAIAIPPDTAVKEIAEFYKGFRALVRKHSVLLVGGDTCSSRKGFIVSVTALGETKKTLLLRRSGARPGDSIFVTGTLGDSAAGLEMLRAEGMGHGAWGNKLIQKHRRPVPRIVEGRAIARSKAATAMIDVSDGLSLDLSHICEQSGVGAELFADRIPLSGALRKSAGSLSMPILDYALSGGEDYELLFTVPPGNLKKFKHLKVKATEIGMITEAPGLSIINADGGKKPLPLKGYDHFRCS